MLRPAFLQTQQDRYHDAEKQQHVGLLSPKRSVGHKPFGSFGDFSSKHPGVADGVLQGLLQALQLVTSVLGGGEEGGR